MKDFHCYGCQKIFGKPNKDGGLTSLLCEKCQERQKSIGKVEFMQEAYENSLKNGKSPAVTELNHSEKRKTNMEIVFDNQEKINGALFGKIGSTELFIFKPKSDFVRETSINALFDRLKRGAYVINELVYAFTGTIATKAGIKGVTRV